MTMRKLNMYVVVVNKEKVGEYRDDRIYEETVAAAKRKFGPEARIMTDKAFYHLILREELKKGEITREEYRQKMRFDW